MFNFTQLYNQRIIISILLSITLTANEVKFYKPSFSCSNIKKESIEYKICSDKELSQLDTILSRTYQSFRLITNEIKQEQKAWLKQRNKCKTKECIKESYLSRTEQLLISLKGQKTFPKHILDVMESVEKNKLLYVKGVTTIEQYTKEEKAFKNDLFHFRNFTFIKPIKSNLSYDSEELKKYLGKCWKYEIYKVPYAERELDLRDGVKVGKLKFPLLDDKENYKNKLKFSIYNTVKLKGREYYLLDYNSYFFIIDKERCASFGKKHNFNITKAFNADIVRQVFSLLSGKFYLVKYKNQLAVLNVFNAGINQINFELYELLDNDGRANKDLFVYKELNQVQFLDKNSTHYKFMLKRTEKAKKLKNRQRN